MAFFRIEPGSHLQPIAATTFSDLGMKERQDLQALLRDNPKTIGIDLLVFAEEFSNWQDSSRRVDLLALDRNSNLVVIELKRVEEGGHMELQALRYAAMLSTVDFPQVREAYEKLLSNPAVAAKRGITAHDAEQQLLDFLGAITASEVNISSTPRIILMAPSFSKEMTTTVLWLNEREVDIRCVSVQPYEIDGKRFLEIEQVIPLPSSADYMVQKKAKEAKAEKQAVDQKRRSRSLPTLVEAKMLNPGDVLELIRLPRGILKDVPQNARYADLIDETRVKWHFNGNEYSLTSLCAAICAQFAPEVLPVTYAFAGPDNWARAGEKIWLSELARSLEMSPVELPNLG
jgi:hypothetical protein